jgi:hypothetical protein
MSVVSSQHSQTICSLFRSAHMSVGVSAVVADVQYPQERTLRRLVTPQKVTGNASLQQAELAHIVVFLGPDVEGLPTPPA